MKQLLYIYVNRSGHIRTRKRSMPKGETDEGALMRPEQIPARLAEEGYALSNWHIIEPDEIQRKSEAA